MSQAMDEFVLNYTLQRLDKKIDTNRDERLAYQTSNDSAVASLDTRTTNLETEQTNTDTTINNIITTMNSIQAELNSTKNELNKTKMINIKQSMTIRTLHNLTAFEAQDMYADTFADGTKIDWENSVRSELLASYQAIGRTDKSTKVLSQESVPSYLLVSADGASDEALAQTFQLDKDRTLDKVSLFIEPHSVDTWQSVFVKITSTRGGTALTSIEIPVSSVTGGWIDIDLVDVPLTALTEYNIEVSTPDTYGYRIGMDINDTYLGGTSYALFNGTWTDNAHDIGFKVFCFAAADETDAIAYTLPVSFTYAPVQIVFEKEDILIDGSINYHVSRDGGVTWKLLQPGIATDLTDLPTGTNLVIRADITGTSRIEAWGYVVKRGES